MERGQNTLEAPLDFAIVVAWRAIMGALLQQRVDADMLRLVHLSNSYRVLDDSAPLREGDECVTSAEVIKRRIQGTGLCVGVEATVKRAGKDVLLLTSEFLYRDGGQDYSKVCVCLGSYFWCGVCQGRCALLWSLMLDICPSLYVLGACVWVC